MSKAPIEELKALAHPLRLQILEVLRDGERNVGEIEEVSGIGQPALSQQLGVLRKAGLVETRKDAKLVFYSLSRDELGKLAALVNGLVLDELETSGGTRAASSGAANFAHLT